MQLRNFLSKWNIENKEWAVPFRDSPFFGGEGGI